MISGKSHLSRLFKFVFSVTKAFHHTDYFCCFFFTVTWAILITCKGRGYINIRNAELLTHYFERMSELLFTSGFFLQHPISPPQSLMSVPSLKIRSWNVPSRGVSLIFLVVTDKTTLKKAALRVSQEQRRMHVFWAVGVNAISDSRDICQMALKMRPVHVRYIALIYFIVC